MAKMRTHRVVDPSYLTTAPIQDGLVRTIPASAEATFRCLEDGDAWGEWIDAIQGVEWTSPKPFGVGTTRTVQIKPGGQIDEEFFAWEDGRRMAFYFVRSGLPMFGAFAENYELEPQGSDRCLLRWSWAFEGAGPFRFVQQLLNTVFRTQGKKSMDALENYMRANGDKYQ